MTGIKRNSIPYTLESVRISRIARYHALTQFPDLWNVAIHGPGYITETDQNMSKEEATTIVEAWLLENI